MTVLLVTSKELCVGHWIGCRRCAEAERKRRKAGFPEKKDYELFAHHMNGATAEIVHARYVGGSWGRHTENFRGKRPDVLGPDGVCWEVRFSNRASWLKVLDEDPDHWNAVLYRRLYDANETLVQAFELVGWIPIHLAKRKEWYGDPGERNRPCYMVPVSELREL